MSIKQKFIQHVSSALSDAYDNKSKVSQDILNIEGMSGTKTRHFYNNILNIDDARYLEIGTWMGSTACAAMYENKATVVCVDNWSEFEGNLQIFLNNFNKYRGRNNASFIEQDCFTLDLSKLPKFNIYMYDGNHSEDAHYFALKYFLPCLDDTFIFIVDDWNWDCVSKPTYKAIADLNLTVDYEKTIIVPYDIVPDKNTWWNGVGIFVLTKPSV